MKYFIDRLVERSEKINSHICVGLDPHLDLFPPFLLNNKDVDNLTNRKIGEIIQKFNHNIIDNIKDIAVAVKPQIAFYERIGAPGLEALHKTAQYASKQGLLVILDAKRNDIGSTAEAYANAYLDKPYIDAITVNPYLGKDSLKPFLARNRCTSFALVRTSNNGARDIQDIITDTGSPLYEKIGQLVKSWGSNYLTQSGYSNLGAVIGATYPQELADLRKIMPNTYFLVPGYGAQGGGAEDIKAAFNKDGKGAIINSARGIIFAYQRKPWTDQYTAEEYGKAARQAALKMRSEINNTI